MTLLLFLHLEIIRRDSKVIDKIFNGTRMGADFSSGTPIFKIRILAQFVRHDLLK